MILFPKTTGILKTNEIRSTKSIHALLLCMNVATDALVNETITVWIERVNRSNVYLATNVKLKAFIALTNFGVDSIQSNSEFATIAMCQLSDDGNVQLNEGELLKFKIDGLKSTMEMAIYGIEEPNSSFDFYTFDRKNISSEDTQRVVSVENSELTHFSTATVEEIGVAYGNGVTLRYLPFELSIVTRDIDPTFHLMANGTTTQGLSNEIILPTVGIATLEFQKTPGTLVEVTSRISKNLLEIE
jgi:hypothetical protein